MEKIIKGSHINKPIDIVKTTNYTNKTKLLNYVGYDYVGRPPSGLNYVATV